MHRYDKGPVVGNGTYATVYRAVCRETGETVALKKLRQAAVSGGVHGCCEHLGVSQAALREIKALQELRHPNIVRLLEVLPHKRKLVLAFEFCGGGDLEQLIRQQRAAAVATATAATAARQQHQQDEGHCGGDASEAGAAGCGALAPGPGRPLAPAEHGPGLDPGAIKSYLQMMMQALAHCHSQGVVHRDVKPNNLLIGEGGVLKLADFGLSRAMAVTEEAAARLAAARKAQEPGEQAAGGGCGISSSGGGGDSPHSGEAPLTQLVCMRWYRAPELLFGAHRYSAAVDVWAAGCVFAEMLLGTVWFQGTSDVDQLSRIFDVVGSPSEARWPGAAQLQNYLPWPNKEPTDLSLAFPHASPGALDLLSRMVALDPARRISTAEALAHPYFTTCQPPPLPPQELPVVLPKAKTPASEGFYWGGGFLGARCEEFFDDDPALAEDDDNFGGFRRRAVNFSDAFLAMEDDDDDLVVGGADRCQGAGIAGRFDDDAAAAVNGMAAVDMAGRILGMDAGSFHSHGEAAQLQEEGSARERHEQEDEEGEDREDAARPRRRRGALARSLGGAGGAKDEEEAMAVDRPGGAAWSAGPAVGGRRRLSADHWRSARAAAGGVAAGGPMSCSAATAQARFHAMFGHLLPPPAPQQAPQQDQNQPPPPAGDAAAQPPRSSDASGNRWQLQDGFGAGLRRPCFDAVADEGAARCSASGAFGPASAAASREPFGSARCQYGMQYGGAGAGRYFPFGPPPHELGAGRLPPVGLAAPPLLRPPWGVIAGPVQGATDGAGDGACAAAAEAAAHLGPWPIGAPASLRPLQPQLLQAIDAAATDQAQGGHAGGAVGCSSRHLSGGSGRPGGGLPLHPQATHHTQKFQALQHHHVQHQQQQQQQHTAAGCMGPPSVPHGLTDWPAGRISANGGPPSAQPAGMQSVRHGCGYGYGHLPYAQGGGQSVPHSVERDVSMGGDVVRRFSFGTSHMSHQATSSGHNGDGGCEPMSLGTAGSKRPRSVYEPSPAVPRTLQLDSGVVELLASGDEEEDTEGGGGRHRRAAGGRLANGGMEGPASSDPDAQQGAACGWAGGQQVDAKRPAGAAGCAAGEAGRAGAHHAARHASAQPGVAAAAVPAACPAAARSAPAAALPSREAALGGGVAGGGCGSAAGGATSALMSHAHASIEDNGAMAPVAGAPLHSGPRLAPWGPPPEAGALALLPFQHQYQQQHQQTERHDGEPSGQSVAAGGKRGSEDGDMSVSMAGPTEHSRDGTEGGGAPPSVVGPQYMIFPKRAARKRNESSSVQAANGSSGYDLPKFSTHMLPCMKTPLLHRLPAKPGARKAPVPMSVDMARGPSLHHMLHPHGHLYGNTAEYGAAPELTDELPLPVPAMVAAGPALLLLRQPAATVDPGLLAAAAGPSVAAAAAAAPLSGSCHGAGAGGGMALRPQPAAHDLHYLRRRKMECDQALLQASQQDPPEALQL